MRITRAIVRPPGANFAEGLTSGTLGAPEYLRALEQHESYCAALQRCGLALTRLEPDPRYPDSTFVEDTAILTERDAILTRPGAASRRGEVEGMRQALAPFYPKLDAIESPGTLDGGDVCQAGGRFFVGISARTNAEGARQLAVWLARLEYTSAVVDIRGVPGLLHLKSGVASLDDNRLVAIGALAEHPAFEGYDVIRVPQQDEDAANCVRIGEHLLLPAGSAALEATLRGLGYSVVPLPMSEFRKMDGGLSCLSLRF